MKIQATPVVLKGMGVEHAYRAIRREIVSLALRPGSALDEAAIATRLGLSRTPVREALVRLAAESLVVLLPNRGASVAGMEWDQIREFLEAFDLEQRVVTRWAALRRTPEQLAAIDAECAVFERHARGRNTEEMNESNWRFHALIAEACGNRLVERSYRHLLTLALRIAYLAYDPECFLSPGAYRTHMDAILREHVAMVAAIRNRDAGTADALGRSHAHLARDRIMDVLSRGASGALDIALDP
ncbi:HTH-type transcriptional repressor RspR [Methylobacterium crusticola]|uniref:HTH-type transcriptional repressor RspR n=1 Tax=Methylobacterium crusticola TaxID=1697972 RepID=A0ABQ4R5I9_9HYPH|nr:GntR family transcriptional regulator [Methylobacterium crusticola]GJD52951.1 HTH-type transcriptional repressor RspR [Methylobacterium crusticola]